MEQHTPIRPGEQVKIEMERRGWNQSTLAEVLGRPRPFVNRLIHGKVTITARTAHQLADAFEGTTPDEWMRLQTNYDLSRVTPKAPARSPQPTPRSILRPDVHGQPDDLVIENVSLVRLERMGNGCWWLACYRGDVRLSLVLRSERRIACEISEDQLGCVDD